MNLKKLILALPLPFVLLGCPDSAKPDPATAAKDAGTAAAIAPKAAGSAAAPAKSGGW